MEKPNPNGPGFVGDELVHFVKLARQGKFHGASSGAIAAREIALTICEHGTTLDGQATEGLVDYIRAAKQSPEIARELLDR
jgi:hypothetical protein